MDDLASPVGQSELVKLLADHAEDVIYRIRLLPDPAYEYISPSVETVMGYSPAEYYADVSLGFRTVHPEDRDKAMSPDAPPVALRGVRRDGAIVYLEQRHRLIQDESGAVVAIEGVCRNVTQRVEVEEALRRSEANFRSLIELSPMLVAVLRDGLLIYANAAAETFLGVPRGRLLGNRALDFAHPDDRPPLIPIIDGGLGEGEVSPLLVTRVRRHDGVEVLAEASSMGISWDAGPALLVVGRDITERQRLLQRLAASERLASLGTLAAGVAHEINNPLSCVIAEIDLALRTLEVATQPEADAVASLKSARDGALRIARVVRDIHAFARPETLTSGPVDVLSAIERAIDLTRTQVRHRARLERDLAPVPPVMADESRLVQVLVNLIANAADAVETATPSGTITITTTHQDSAVIISISDTGKGIPAEELAHVFDPFFTTKSVGTSMGLGLAISHSIVTQLGGTIQVQSEVNCGTTFHVSLPQSNGPAAERAPSPPSKAAARARILFIDDEVSLCSAMSRLLQPEHEVVTATRVQEALEILGRGAQFDMILCDLMMPGMTGMAFFEALSDLPHVDRSSVVFMTGGAFGEAAQHFQASIPNACFPKPLDPDQLRQWLQARQLANRSKSVSA